MMPITLKHAVLTAALMAWAIALPAQEQNTTDPKAPETVESLASWEQKAAQARKDENWVQLYVASMKLHSERPFEPAYMMDIIRAAAALNQRQTAYKFIMEMQQQGLSYDMNEIPETAGMRGAEAYDYLNNLLIEAGQSAGDGQDVLSLPGQPVDIGDFAWDETRQRFLLGTRREGKLLAVADDGSTELLLQADDENGLWSIDGLAVDAPNKTLWIASSASPAFAGYTPADALRGGLFRFDLETLELLGQYTLALDGLPHSLGGMAVTAGGEVYVIDRAVPIVFRKPAEGDRLEPFLAMPRLVALTDLAVTPDNSRMFVADAVMGVLAIDPVAGGSALLKGPENLNLYGIYNVEYIDGSLVVTQSGISPQRIVRLDLDKTGVAVEKVSPLAVALEGFDTPGVGTIRDGRLYYFANHGTQGDDDRMRMMVTSLEGGVAYKQPDPADIGRALRQKMAEQGAQPPQ
jgi:hypothetical protein